MTPPVVRRTSASSWRGALDVGELHPSEQDLPGLLLHIDPARTPADPLAPLPTAAVLAAVADRDPVWQAPAADDDAARALTYLFAYRRRRAAVETPVTGGVAIRDDRFPSSHDHNALLIFDAVPTETVLADADRTLAGLAHRRVLTPVASVADGLREVGWDVEQLTVMALRTRDRVRGSSQARAEQVDGPVAAHLWRRSWREAMPDITDDVLRDLLGREPLEHTVSRVHDLAVFVGNLPVAGAQIRIDGATAALDTVLTLRDHRGAGRAAAAVDAALDLADDAGCDLVVLEADADDWPQHWYARLGFRPVGGFAACAWLGPLERS